MTPASIKKHPLHPILVAIPIGLLIFSLVCDFVYFLGGHVLSWAEVAYYTLGGGIVGALIAAVPGLVDLLSIQNPEHKRTGIIHMCVNLVAVALFVADFWLRRQQAAPTAIPFVLSLLGVGLLGVGGWLGGHLVHVAGISVDTESAGEIPTRQQDTESAGHDVRSPRGMRRSAT